MAGQEARMLRLVRSDPGRTPQQAQALAEEVRAFARWLAAREPSAMTASSPEAPPAAAPPAGQVAAPPSAPPPAAQAAAPPPAAQAVAPPPAAGPAAPATPPPAMGAPPEPATAVAAPSEPAPVAAEPPPTGPVVRMDPIVNPRDPQALAAAQPVPTAPVVAAAAPPSGQGALVQLGALESEAAAQRQWAALSARVSGLGGRTPSIERFEAGGRTVWRLRVRGLSSLAEANAVCGQVRAAGGPCFASR
jgi:hypothetical protein